MAVGKMEKRNLARKNAEVAKAEKKQTRDAKNVAPAQKKKATKRK